MQVQTTHRSNYIPTRHRGLSFRLKGNGEKAFYGYVGSKRVRLQNTTEREALVEWNELRGKAARGERVATTAIKFGVVAESWFELKQGKIREATRRGYRASLDNVILPRFEHRKIRDISYEEIVRLVHELEAKGLSTSTVDSHLLVLRLIWKYAKKQGHVTTSPVELVDKDDRGAKREKDTARVWSQEEVDSVVASAEYLARQPESRHDYSGLISLTFSLGLRLGEVLGLQWGDVDLSGGYLSVNRQWTRFGEYAPPKTKAGVRRIPLSPDLVRWLRELKLASEFSQDEHPVFASKIGTPLGHRNVTRRGWEPAVVHAELADKPSFHQARHAFASRLIANGIQPVVLAAVLGHEDVKTTLGVYSHVWDQTATDDLVRQALSV